MAILVDYRCTSCGARAEHWSPSPPPGARPCGSCGAESRRLFAAVGLSAPGSAPQPAGAGTGAVTGAGTGKRSRSLCSSYPQIPGLCHMSESAGRMWVAKYLKDGRGIDREQERQETQAAVTPPTLADAVTHHHAAPAAPAATASADA